MLFQKIKADSIAALKSGPTGAVTRSLLVILVSDLTKIEKDEKREVVDLDVFALIKKYLDANTAFQNANPPEDRLAILKEEAAILKAYMPTQLTDEEINEIITLVTDGQIKNLGQIMKYFSSNYPNRYDGKILSDKIKARLA